MCGIVGCTGGQNASEILQDAVTKETVEKCGYEHFMLKEIMEQPAAVMAAIAPRIKGGRIVLEDFPLSDGELRGIKKIVITACGSAYYAGCCARYAIEKLCRIPVMLELASEFRYSDPIIDEETLMIIISQSGETADTIAAMKEGKARGAKTVAVVNVVDSTIAQLADSVLYEWAGPEIAVATTKGFTTQLAVLYLLAVYMADKLGKLSKADYAKCVADIGMLPKKIQAAIDMNSEVVKELAERYSDKESIYFLGRNTDYALALEASLKMKETSYVHAEAYAAGELKHGTIALIEDGTPMIAICCNKNVLEKTTHNIIELREHGAEILVVTFKENRDMLAHADHVLFVPDAEAIFSHAAAIVPLQLLAYHVAKRKGCDIDNPNNLTKAVTVE